MGRVIDQVRARERRREARALEREHLQARFDSLRMHMKAVALVWIAFVLAAAAVWIYYLR